MEGTLIINQQILILKIVKYKSLFNWVVAGRHYAMDRDKNWHNVKKFMTY